MKTAQVIAQMLEIAHPIVKAYHGDLRHDARLIADAAPDAAFLWAPVANGSRIIVLRRGDKPNVRAAEIFDAMTGHGRQGEVEHWYLIRLWADVDMGEIERCEDCDAQKLARDVTQRAAQRSDAERISELNM
jgi:hypothetical protein